MPPYTDKQFPTDPPPGVSLDKTQAPIYFEEGIYGDFARLRRWFHRVFTVRRSRR